MCDFCVNVYIFVRKLLVCENIHMQISHVSRCLDTSDINNKINEKHFVFAIEKACFVVLLVCKTN